MRYRLTGSLEGGALSELFAATGDDRFPLAMKLFFAHTTDRAYAREIGRIAQRVNQLNLPGLIRVYEVGLVKDRLAVVRDALNGSTVAQLLARLAKRENFISTTLSFSFLIDYLGLLQQAHQGGIIHGSITPGNLQLLSTGAVAVCDFGAIQAIRHSPRLQRLFSSGGRDVYRAPELLDGEPPTEASDIYSLAAVGYELLTLKEPRPEGGDFRRGAIVPPSRLDRRLSPRVDSILMRALDPSPGRRFGSCADFAEALRELVAVSGGGVAEEERQRAAGAGVPQGTLGSEEGLGPVPFAEPFSLSEASVFRLPDESLALHAGPRVGGAAAELHRDGLPYDDDTDPEPTAATEGAWEAPPGMVSGLRRRVLGQPSASRPIRVRWVQDLSTPPVEEEDEATVADPAMENTAVAPRRRGRGRGKKAASVIPVHFPRRETSDEVNRPPGRPRMLTPAPRTMWLKEVPLDWRWPAGILGAGLLVLLGAWAGRASHPDLVTPVPLVLEAAKVVPPPPPERDLGFDLPPQGGGASLSVLTNLPARVYIDGRLVKRLAPMDRYPVRLGMHRIVVEALATQERQEEVINFVKNSMQSMDATFGESP